MELLSVTPDALEQAAQWYDASRWLIITFGSVAAIAAIGTVISTLIEFWSGGMRGRTGKQRAAHWSSIIFGSVAAIAAIGTVISTLTQFWSGGVLDRHTEWRTASLELETAKSRERSAELEKEIIRARSVLAEEQKKRILLQSGLSARDLTDRKKEALVDAWRGFAGRKVSVFAYLSVSESLTLAEQIIECMQSAGLIVDDQTRSNAQLAVFIPHILVGGPDEALVKIISYALASIGLETTIGSPPAIGLNDFEPTDASIFVGLKSLPSIEDPMNASPVGPVP